MKPARNVNSFVILILLLLAVGCGKPHISEDVLVKIYVENLIALETYSFNADSLISHQNKVFNKYHISRNDFEQQMKDYSEDSKEWEDFFKQANNYLAELKEKNIIN